mgnify:CR=1 FL=1
MGLYGSPELGPYRTEETKFIKKEGYKPQKNIWVWVVILIMNILILLLVGITIQDVLTLLALDSIILFGISVVSLVVNLINKRKIGNDIKFIGISILTFFIFVIILGTL